MTKEANNQKDSSDKPGTCGTCRYWDRVNDCVNMNSIYFDYTMGRDGGCEDHKPRETTADKQGGS